MANRIRSIPATFRSGRTQRRLTRWLSVSTFTNNTIGVGGAALLTNLSAVGLAYRPFTIVRSRGVIFVASDQQAGSENYGISYGQIVITEVAEGVGITAVPTPIAEPESDWFVFKQVLGRLVLSDATGIYEAGHMVEYDSKAMRKVDVGDQVSSVVEVPATGISEGVLFRSFLRVLIKTN